VEIALLKRCHHPKIVEYIGGWQKGAELFIAMELYVVSILCFACCCSPTMDSCDGASIDRLMETLLRGLTVSEGLLLARPLLLTFLVKEPEIAQVTKDSLMGLEYLHKVGACGFCPVALVNR
jgi:hypothetical protein